MNYGQALFGERRLRTLPVQTRNRPEVHAGHGTHGKPADGDGTSGCGMGAAENAAAGKRDQETCEGVSMMTLWETQEAEEMARNRQWEEVNDVPDYSEQVKSLEEVCTELDRAVDLLLDVEELLSGTPYEREIRDAIHKVQYTGCDIGLIAKKLK